MTQVNLSMKQKQTHRHREQACGCQGVGGEGEMDWEFGVSRCKPEIYIEWINNKVLLYSIENYIQYPVMNQNEKEFLKECTHIYIHLCITESLWGTEEINTL